MGLLTGFGFSAPYFLAVLPIAAGLLVYAYLRRGSGNRQPVASILLLKRLRSTMSARKKFVPPLRFFFELLLLVLLGGAAAGLYRKGPEERLALVLDNSQSMAAEMGVGESRFEAAKQDLEAYLGSVSERAKMALFVTSPALHQVNDDLISAEEVLSKLDTVSPVFAADGIEPALAKLVQDTRFDRVIAWSDKSLAAANTRLQVRSPLTAGASNLAIRDIRIERRGEKGDAVVAEIASYASRPAAIKVSFSAFNTVAGMLTEVKLGEKPLNLPASGTISLELVTSAAAAAYSVRIETPSVTTQDHVNSLKSDDVGYLVTSAGANRLTVVSDSPLSGLGVQRLKSFSANVITPAEYQAQARHDGVFVFHRTLPNEFPASNALFVLPPPGSQLGGSLKQADSIEITHWSESHPIVNYLNVPMLSLRTLVPLKKPVWAEEILASNQGIAAFAGEYRGHRYVGLGFEIFPYEGKREPVLSILMLNVLKWLSGATLNSGYEPVPYVIPSEKEGAEVKYISGGATDSVVIEHDHVMATVPGLISVSTASGAEVHAINFFNEEEANTQPLRKISVPEATLKADDAARDNRPLTSFIIWFVFLLMAGDLALILRPLLQKRREVVA